MVNVCTSSIIIYNYIESIKIKKGFLNGLRSFNKTPLDLQCSGVFYSGQRVYMIAISKLDQV